MQDCTIHNYLQTKFFFLKSASASKLTLVCKWFQQQHTFQL